MRALLVHPGPHFSVEDVYQGWVRGLRANGVEVIDYDLGDRMWLFQNAYLKRDDEFLLAMPFKMAVECAAEGLGTWIYETWPDVVIIVSGFFIKADAMRLIRRRGQKVVLICTESPYEDDSQLKLAEAADLVVVNDPTNLDRFAQVTKAVYVPHSYNPDVHRPGPPDPDLHSDLCIIGTGYESRKRWLEQADLDGLDVALLGNWQCFDHEPDHPLVRHVRQDKLDQCIANEDAVRWYQSTRASLNLYRREAQRPELAAGWSMGPREVELAACGTFYLSEPRGENVEVLPFVPKVTAPGEFRELLDWWLAHDRERDEVVRRARETLHGWTFENRARDLLQMIDG